MFIKVTNCSHERAGDPLIININEILSVYEDHIDGGSLRTVIYSRSGLTWNVEESIEKVNRLIDSAVEKMKR